MPYSAKVRRLRYRDKPAETQAVPSTPVASRADESRKELLAQISDFLIKHDLSVTGGNLGIVCSALSGSNAQLSETLAARETSGDPIDQRWLDTISRLDPQTNARMAELEKLSDQLEYSLMRFAQTTKSAADQTSDGREALGAHIKEVEQSAETSERRGEFDLMITLSRVMLERIEQVETAMEKSQRETSELRENLAKARMEADVDHLTRLPNRRAFERRFASASDEARAKGEPLCVAFCDVDHFKAVNDTHGHDAGDRILVAIAGTLNEIASDDCFVSRHGGEEFVLLFFGFDKDAAWRKLDGVRRIMARRQLMNRDTGKPFGKITFSGGIAEVTEDINNRSALTRADAALYQAKEQGRNRIISI